MRVFSCVGGKIVALETRIAYIVFAVWKQDPTFLLLAPEFVVGQNNSHPTMILDIKCTKY